MNKEYIVGLLEKNERIDGRKLDSYRKITVENGVSKNAEGSARVKIGDTEVIAGVKMDVGEPYFDSQDKGVLIMGAELSPLSSEDFEPGPPSTQAVELARVVDRGIRESNSIDMKKLCIKKKEKVWMVFIDIYIVNADGNLLDAAALASIAALKNAKFPEYDEKNERVKYGELSKKSLPLDKLPIACTLYKIGNKIVADVSNEEEKIVDARLTVTMTEEGIHGMQKGGDKTLSIKEIDEMVKIAEARTKELRELL
ncbi:RNA-binding protein [archaeon]|nr:RNA-binding protein [archaeon]|tara:strand:+ start:2472 stop:3236 length:765 start_codon:yes stop_codon:yes gene_type:complete